MTARSWVIARAVHDAGVHDEGGGPAAVEVDGVVRAELAQHVDHLESP
jgi:hypothetical protein